MDSTPESPQEAKLGQLRKLRVAQEDTREALVEALADLNDEILQTDLEYRRIKNSELRILALPPEITCTIFAFVCSPRHSFFAYMSPYYSQEITLSHVCHHWRSISLADATLWSAIQYSPREMGPIDEDILSDGLKEALVERVVAYLQRSRNGLLDVWISFDQRNIGDLYFHMAVMNRIFEHRHRWRSLSIEMPLAFHHQGPFPAILEDLNAPNLETLHLYGDTLATDPAGTIVHPPFTYGMPNLKHLSTTTVMSTRSFPSLSAITTLQIDGQDNSYPWTLFQDLLRSPNLTTLSIAGGVFEPPHQIKREKSRVISANKLKHLRITDDIVADYMWLYIHAPVLQLLILKRTDPSSFRIGPESVAQYNNGTIPTPFPSLQTFAFIDNISSGQPTWAREQSLALSQATPSITSLIIADLGGRSKLYDHLTAYQPTTILWPEVTSFTYDVDLLVTRGGETFSGEYVRQAEALSQFIECRSTKLKKQCLLRLPTRERPSWSAYCPSLLASLEESRSLEFLEFDEDSEIKSIPVAPFNPGGVFGVEIQGPFDIET